MLKRSLPILLAWCLLLGAAVAAGVFALRLVGYEEARLAESARAAARQRAAASAESIALAVGEVREGLWETLSGLPSGDRVDRLERWQRENPLVRNTFLWRVGAGLLHPLPEGPADAEEAAFLQRYAALFDGRSSWSAPLPDSSGAPSEPAPSEYSPAAAAESSFTSRRELKALAQAPAPTEGLPDRFAPVERGWLPWFADNRLHLLAWVEAPPGERYGVEVESAALFARLLATLPSSPPAGEVYALLDGEGRLFHQTGSEVVPEGLAPEVRLSLAPALPHWELAVYVPQGLGGPSAGFGLVGGLLAATFVAAILLGGALLLWEARLHRRDALRKTGFVANVSHELKTPLTTIRMYAELLAEGRVPEEKRGGYLQTIVGECRRLTRLVNNVLDFGRLEQGRKNYAPERLDLPLSVRAVVEGQAERLAEAGMALELALPEEGIPVTTDRDGLEQVVLNLLDNALKYADGGGSLRVEVAREDGSALLRVLDRGPGVPAAHRGRIFEKFHRVDDALTARRPGSGLGLAISRQLLRDQGGELTYADRPGGGACFEVRLPLELKAGHPG